MDQVNSSVHVSHATPLVHVRKPRFQFRSNDGRRTVEERQTTRKKEKRGWTVWSRWIGSHRWTVAKRRWGWWRKESSWPRGSIPKRVKLPPPLASSSMLAPRIRAARSSLEPLHTVSSQHTAQGSTTTLATYSRILQPLDLPFASNYRQFELGAPPRISIRSSSSVGVQTWHSTAIPRESLRS